MSLLHTFRTFRTFVSQWTSECVRLVCSTYTYAELYLSYLLYDPSANKPIRWNGIPYISYTYKDKAYRVFVDDNRGPPNVLKVTDQGDFDCTDIVRPFLGPSGIPTYARITPSMLGFEKLQIYTLRNGVVVCDAHDDIYTSFTKNN